jgi:hypothetical protein
VLQLKREREIYRQGTPDNVNNVSRGGIGFDGPAFKR